MLFNIYLKPLEEYGNSLLQVPVWHKHISNNQLFHFLLNPMKMLLVYIITGCQQADWMRKNLKINLNNIEMLLFFFSCTKRTKDSSCAVWDYIPSEDSGLEDLSVCMDSS